MCTRTVEHVHTRVYTRIFHVEHCLTPIKRNGVSVGNLLDKIETQIYAVNVEQGFLRCGILSTFGGGAEEDRGCLAQLGILEFPKCLGTPLHAGETIRVQEKLEMRINSPARHVVSSTIHVYTRTMDLQIGVGMCRFECAPTYLASVRIVSSNFELNLRILVARQDLKSSK